MDEPVAVVFRKWRDNGWVIALFPELPSDVNGWYCDSYEHIGQHGGADYQGVVAASVPAQPCEYESLLRELTRIGYVVRPMRRATHQMHEQRQQAARRAS